LVTTVDTMRRMSLDAGPELVNITVELEREALIPVALALTVAVSVMVPRNPLTAVRFRFEIPVVPRTSVRLVGFRESVKSPEDGL